MVHADLDDANICAPDHEGDEHDYVREEHPNALLARCVRHRSVRRLWTPKP